jgi:hypothetical protein
MLRLRNVLLLALLSLLVGIFFPLNPGAAQDDDQPDVPLVELNKDVIKRATVFIMQTYQQGDQSVISCVGSGTLISADGLILTNAHVALPDQTCRADKLVIGITVELDQPPVPTYTAEVLDASLGLDLAILRINGYLDGRVIERRSLQLPFVELGDSAAMELYDTITVFGYPELGSEPVTDTRGTISGFTAEARAGDEAWIRTKATIPGTMTGGGAYNRDGKLIGIPTIAPARAGGEIVDCRVIQDSNGDGRADENDQCVPVGGFISALRPSRLARGLVRASSLGIRQGENYTLFAASAGASGQATFSRLFFCTRINEAGVPANVVSEVPSGTTSLYLFFDYDQMVDGMVYEMRVTLNDNPNLDYSLPPVTWSGGQRGSWYIGSSGIPWENGVYNFRLFIEGREVASLGINIGGGSQEKPQFSDIVFGLPGESDNLVGTSYVLPEGGAVQARFNYRNMQLGLLWTYIWYFENQELRRDTLQWEDAGQGTKIMPATAEFQAGRYRLALYIENNLSATADFIVAGGAEGAAAVIFSDLKFSDAQAGGQPAGALRVDFPAGIEQLYVFFNWRLIAPGTPWTRRWLVDDDVLFEVTEPWTAPPEGENYFLSLDSLQNLPDGTYTFEIRLANIQRAVISAKVGLGQLPVEAFASAEGVQMNGRITDADTGEGVPGAMFIVLESEYSVEDFLWDQSQVLGYSLADSDGHFQLETLLPRGTADEPLLYSILVRAAGYLPLNADGIIVIEDTQSPFELNIKLSRP